MGSPNSESGEVRYVCHHLNAGVGLAVDDGARPWLRGVEGYRHANLTPVHAVGHGQSTTVD
jgi:hypothetical protein